MTQKMKFSVENIELLQDDDIDKSQFSLLKVDAFATGRSLHDTFVTEETLKRTAKTILQKPFVFVIDKRFDDLGSHDPQEVAGGFVPHNSRIEFKELNDGRIMLSCDVLIWKRYSSNLVEYFQRDNNKKSVSVEIEVFSSREDEKSGLLEIVDFCYTAITGLGELIQSAIPNAQAIMAFSKEYEEAYELEFGKYDDLNFKIPQSVKNAAKQGLELREKYGRGGTSVGLATARYLIKNETASPEKVRHIAKYFPRHAGDSLDDKESNGWIAWCLRGDTEVMFYDGTSETIQNICENKIEKEVLSYNTETGLIEPKKIINWFINDSNEGEFIQIGKNKQNRKGLSNKTFLFSTKEHPFFSDNGWVEAGDMNGNNFYYIDYLPSQKMISAMIGTILGDASVSKDGRFILAHGSTQKEYLLSKHGIFKSLGLRYSEKVQKSGYGFGKENYSYRSSVHSFLFEIRELFYKSGNKEVTRDILNLLDDFGIALWFMDDGSLHLDNREKNKKAFYYRLHIEGFGENSSKVIREYFEDNGFKCSLIKRENTDGYALYFSREASLKIAEKIAPYIFDSMKYKIPEYLRDIPFLVNEDDYYLTLSIFPEKVTKFIPASEIKDRHLRNPKMSLKKYNITVEDNNNFFANGILTHNCLWGGDAGRRWSTSLVKKMNELDDKKMSYFSDENNIDENNNINNADEEKPIVEDNYLGIDNQNENNTQIGGQEDNMAEKDEKEKEVVEEKEFNYAELFADEKFAEMFAEVEEDEEEEEREAEEKEKYAKAKEEFASGKNPAAVMSAMYSAMKRMSKRFATMKAKMAKMEEDKEVYMAENADMKKRFAEQDEKAKEFAVDSFIKELSEKVIIPEDKIVEMKTKAGEFSFAEIDGWKNYCKAFSFDFVKKEGSDKRDFITYALPFNNVEIPKTDNVWDKLN